MRSSDSTRPLKRTRSKQVKQEMGQGVKVGNSRRYQTLSSGSASNKKKEPTRKRRKIYGYTIDCSGHEICLLRCNNSSGVGCCSCCGVTSTDRSLRHVVQVLGGGVNHSQSLLRNCKCDLDPSALSCALNIPVVIVHVYQAVQRPVILERPDGLKARISGASIACSPIFGALFSSEQFSRGTHSSSRDLRLSLCAIFCPGSEDCTPPIDARRHRGCRRISYRCDSPLRSGNHTTHAAHPVKRPRFWSQGRSARRWGLLDWHIWLSIIFQKVLPLGPS